ncbi:polyketide synthase [Colletotrichum plurivorum]|uniref:Polyketide synthase n=1 Tax=Colletotrichum plurivorum TaxID=2175906 RepID=A0A8H6NBZ5_9PEZI|nr:polyketide synthase [Colletotrichum plurivorum]
MGLLNVLSNIVFCRSNWKQHGLDLACRPVQSGEVDAAIVASSNIYMSPDHVVDTGSVRKALSPTGLCHTFDVDTDSYIKAKAVSCIICHGTGMPADDATEVMGVGSVFAASRKPDQPLLIGSVKSNIGHSASAAGNSGLIKAILAMEKGVVPGTPPFIKPNPQTKHRQRSFFVSSYAAANEIKNFFVDKKPTPQRPQLLVVTADDANSLKNNIQALSNHLANSRVKFDLPDLAYTLSERRSSGAIKAAVYRGQAPVQRKDEAEADVGILAVDLGAEAVSQYMEKYAGDCWISCFKSHVSVTISGRMSALEGLAADLEAAGHVTKLEQADLA